eukprot:7306062-Karenia_brevis.AAC.1
MCTGKCTSMIGIILAGIGAMVRNDTSTNGSTTGIGIANGGDWIGTKHFASAPNIASVFGIQLAKTTPKHSSFI